MVNGARGGGEERVPLLCRQLPGGVAAAQGWRRRARGLCPPAVLPTALGHTDCGQGAGGTPQPQAAEPHSSAHRLCDAPAAAAWGCPCPSRSRVPIVSTWVFTG